MLTDALGYYELLEVDYNADENIIKQHYREKAKLWHPDHSDNENALEIFQKISVAYDVLKDSKTRAMYDILSMVYKKQDFPDFKTLKIYKTNGGIEDPFLRVVNLVKYTPKGFKSEKLVGSFNDIVSLIKKATQINWTKGWANPKENIKALKNNFSGINKNREDNLKMLLHNAVAYFKEDKKDKAYISAQEAITYASDEQKDMIETFSYLLDKVNYTVPVWDYEYLKNIQLKIPKNIAISVISIVLLLGIWVIGKFVPEKEKSLTDMNYYQEVRFYNGNTTVDDMVLSKIFNIPVDLTDDKMLFHLKSETNIMHGPSDEFDIMVQGHKNQTVRITGYTPDELWYRVMVDDGNMGFVKRGYLKKGIGNPIPERSKIIENNER
ncbi:MAG: J domain-containing protein [Alphaproteobacteria bacterium]|nr:J domain-containing protein [Alphaproteobacteria bacterium]